MFVSKKSKKHLNFKEKSLKFKHTVWRHRKLLNIITFTLFLFII